MEVAVTRVTLPDGCSGLDMADGKKYTADRPGGTVEVSSADARYIGTSWYGETGVMRGSRVVRLATRRGRRCEPCNRTWQAWSARCPRCGEPTEETAEAG
jgi:hypothetical protein